MSEEIIKILNILSEKIGISIDWTQENIIPYLEQLFPKYVNYEIATSIVWIVTGILLIITSIYIFKKLKFYKHIISKNDDGLLYSLLIIIIIIFFIINILIIFAQIIDIVTCFTFPEKNIIDELESIYRNLNK